jgi:hypothetical protein
MLKCEQCHSSDVKQLGPFGGRVVEGDGPPSLNEQIIFYVCNECLYQKAEKILTEGVRVVTAHIARVQSDLDSYRVIVRFVSDSPVEGALIKEFYVWLTSVYVQDYLGILHNSKESDYLRAAVLVAEEGYRKKGQVPDYGGVDCRNSWGRKVVESAETYAYPFTKTKQPGS